MENPAEASSPQHHNLLKRITRIGLKVLASLILFIVIAYSGLGLYIKFNKKKVLDQVTQQLNTNLDGKLTIGDMEPAFFSGFPRVSVSLSNVHLRDRKYAEHKKEFLKAGDVKVAINLFSLLRGAISIGKISISDAEIYLLTDKSGYSNTSVFKKGKPSDKSSSGSLPELKKFSLENVTFTADNQLRNKLFRYKLNELSGDVDFNFSRWTSDITLKGFAESMSFNKKHGSFMHQKTLEGTFRAIYDGSGKLSLLENPLEIGGEKFTIAAHFFLEDPEGKFDIRIKNKNILWKNASHLLADNISEKLDMFAIEKPISVTCDIVGSFSSAEDPLILVNAFILNNTLTTPGGKVEKCNFKGIFTNNYDNAKGFNDANSAIILENFKGEYGTVPFLMKNFTIVNLEDPLAKGDFSSHFNIERINNMVDKRLISFTSGTADINVNFTADIVRFKLEKPILEGKVAINKANIDYAQRGIQCKDVSVGLDFSQDNLYIRNIALNSGKSSIKMDGSVANFLNLYYTDPNKIVVNWNVYSKEFYLGEFLGFFSKRRSNVLKTKKQTGDFTIELAELFEKSNVRLAMKIDKLHYNSFLASDVRAVIDVSDDNISLEKVTLKDASGSMVVTGKLSRTGKVNPYQFNADVSNVNVKEFFREFDNFGMETLTSKNLSGQFSMTAQLSGKLHESGKLVPKSMQGKVDFNLKKGGLRNFDPLRNIGKYAFPHRNLDTILFKDLKGSFVLKGEKVQLAPLSINSSLLNMDVGGIYSFGKGTSLNVDVPLRDPKRDKGITDADELAKRRNRGVVIHLLAVDDKETGKVKIKLTTGRDKKENE